MIAKSNSTTNALDSIISKIEIELEQTRARLYACPSEHEDISVPNTRNKSSLDSLEDVNCRICYDPNPDMPVIYPCKCKV